MKTDCVIGAGGPAGVMLGLLLARSGVDVVVLDLEALQRVQRRREWPVRVVQRMQLTMQDRLIAPILASDKPVRMTGLPCLLDRFLLLRRVPAWFIGVGVRPEHVH